MAKAKVKETKKVEPKKETIKKVKTFKWDGVDSEGDRVHGGGYVSLVGVLDENRIKIRTVEDGSVFTIKPN